MSNLKYKNSLFWFRRDLRLEDNTGLYHALLQSEKVACIFIFDTDIINTLPKHDLRIDFIYNCVQNLKNQLKSLGSDLIVEYGKPQEIITNMAKKYNVSAVYSNEDYEPLAIKRDADIEDELHATNVEFIQYKDTAIFHKNEVRSPQNQAYTVFTYYANQWRKQLEGNEATHLRNYDYREVQSSFAKFKSNKDISLNEMGFEKTFITKTKIGFSNEKAVELAKKFMMNKCSNYERDRNTPILSGTSYLSVHNRFGTISIRELVRMAIQEKHNHKNKAGFDIWISELIWRDFYFQILYHYPHVAYQSFKTKYDDFPWENNMEFFQKWCDGKTGFPLVDAAMHQLNNTGYMHNRLRMVCASFLTKHLLIDYKLGEAYFASKLLDYDLSANNGGWQWAASTGCDSQPYFRIFNPHTQSEKFDPLGLFIKKYLPVFADVPGNLLHNIQESENALKKYNITLDVDYPRPIIEHKSARAKVLALFDKFEKE